MTITALASEDWGSLMKKRLNFTVIILLIMCMAVMPLMSACSAQKGDMISSVSDLNKSGYTIGVPEGTPPEEVAKQYMPNAKISYFTQFIDGVAALKSGKVTAVCYDSSGVDRILLNNPDLVKIPEELGNIEIAAVMRQNDTAMCDQINTFIKQLKDDGTSDEMYARWIEKIGGKMPDIPKPQSPAKKLKIITNGLTEPMNYYENGELTGYDIEFCASSSSTSKKSSLASTIFLSTSTMSKPIASLRVSFITGIIIVSCSI